MKKCQFCAEEVDDEALKCRYCGEWLKNKLEEAIKPIEKSEEKKFEFKKVFLWWTVALSILLILFFRSIEADGNTITIIFPSIFLATLFSIIATIIHKSIFERKNPQSKTLKNSDKKDFLERDSINENDSDKVIKVKKQWNNFIGLFWLLFFMKIASNGGSSVNDQDIVLLLFVLQIFAVGSMVILMGYYSYKFSGKKSYWLFGLLGLLWFAIIGIFIGFWQVQRLKNEKIGIKKTAKSFKLS